MLKSLFSIARAHPGFKARPRIRFGSTQVSYYTSSAVRNGQTFDMTGSPEPRGVKRKLHGRDFYRSIGSPKFILAPMVDQSEFAWRLLTRSFMSPEENRSLLAYTPMFHARMFSENPKYRDNHFQPLHGTLPSPPDEYHASQLSPESMHLDGNTETDRPLFVQFCANEPQDFLGAAQHVAPYCDAVDLNLGCPQGIAKRGQYGAFLQEHWDKIDKLISTLHQNLSVPVTAKFRIQESKEKTLAYAQMILDAGASIITVHGRQRDQKGHNTGLADWEMIRFLRDSLPPETVIFANGNVLQYDDIQSCLDATGADGVMSAEGNLYDPSIFSTPPPVGQEGREYWRGPDGKGGWRMDAAFRRYMDIIHRYVLQHDPPVRATLYITSVGPPPTTSNTADAPSTTIAAQNGGNHDPSTGPPKKKHKNRDRKREQAREEKEAKGKSGPAQKQERTTDPNLTAMQAHLFHMLRSLVAKHTHIRDALARSKAGDIEGFERILSMVEEVVAQGVAEHASSPAATVSQDEKVDGVTAETVEAEELKKEAKALDPHLSSLAAVERCRRPWFICQPYVRPLPKEALEKGALQVSKKERKRLELEREEAEKAGLGREGRVEVHSVDTGKVGGRVDADVDGDVEGKGIKRKIDHVDGSTKKGETEEDKVEIAREGLVCG